MKLRSARIKIVVELAQREEENAASLFQKAQQELETEHQRLRELEQQVAEMKRLVEGTFVI